ncbi:MULTISPECIES: hypothetical protein [unclassified Brenneria]|uniref:hypothetical protein n=1 Tax=unclassified Brenneria TaxID=2634434 RepID=UPI0029C1DB70|nr:MULTISPECIES: hypothetical protein [unclassified Brenneria]MDX5629097.1 hypothetical protein [Brenneria sp. L3-3Z]MDX5696236.1 hypothetical protein [Brenneria sp. L4-2C]MEE3662904.1 hypothetical protein [Brenneria sp. g21c3]
MSLVQAFTYYEAEELIKAGIVRKIKLAFDIGSDDFFKLAMLCTDRGGKIFKKDDYFIISMKKTIIPANVC